MSAGHWRVQFEFKTGGDGGGNLNGDYRIITNMMKGADGTLYWHRSSGSDGRFWSAVNGQVAVDHHGPNMGVYGLPITRIMITNPYSGGHAPVESHMTGLEIWNGFPCGVGLSRYK